MMRSAGEAAKGHGVTMLSNGKSVRKSLAFRVMRPSLACASAPIITSATGRRAVFPDRLLWTWLFHAAIAIDKSSSRTSGGRSIPISKRNLRSRASSPRKAGASSTYVSGDTIRPPSACLSIASADATPNLGSRSSTSSMTHVSTTMLTAVLPREVPSSIQRWFAVPGMWMHSRASLWRLCAVASARLSLCRCRDSAPCSRADSCRASSACIRGLTRGWIPAHVR